MEEKLYDLAYIKVEGACILATIVRNEVHFLVLNEKNSEVLELKKKILKLEESKEQDCLYCCTFGGIFPVAQENNLNHMLACGGKQGIIYLINLDNNFETSTLIGNVNDIYDLAFAPYQLNEKNKNLLLSCAKDTSIILWDVNLKIQIALFKTGNNPPADTISIDWHKSGEKFVVAGLDGSIKVWELGKDVIANIEKAKTYEGDRHKFPRQDVKKPILHTYDLHSNYTDCARFWDDCILSRDVEGNIVLSGFDQRGNVCTIARYTYTFWESIWFVRFSVLAKYGLITIGNDNGEVSVYKIGYSDDSRKPIAFFDLSSKTIIRKSMITDDLNYFLAISDDGRLWVHNLSSEKFKSLKEPFDRS